MPINKEEKEKSHGVVFRAKEISDEELKSLTGAINKKYGVDFTNYESKSLKRGFARLITKKKLDSVLNLWSKILGDKQFFLESIDELTVNLTEMFRNPEIWVKMKGDVLPHFKEQKTLDIWHAGCSSGEEVYSMAIVLKDAGLLKQTQAMATDLSKSILSKAKEGKYSAMLMKKYGKSFSEYIKHGSLDDCFEYDDDNHAVVKSELKKHITFKQHNLIHDPMYKTFDIIFCRNVMIYFDDALKLQILKMFLSKLKPGGFFVLGYYDMISKEGKDLFEVFDSKTRVYRKK
jgi:chemotaxis protein methyltransferase CheR